MDQAQAAIAIPAANDREQRAERFLFRVAIATLVYCIVGFSLRAVTDAPTLARVTVPVALHGLLMTGWLTLFASQAWLKQRGLMARHMRIGRASWPVAIAIFAVGLWITYDGSLQSGPAFLALNASGFVNFGILYALALRAALHGQYDTHKRLMLIATISFIGPATTRYLAVFGGPPPLAILSLPAAVIAIPLAYDLIARGRWHRASITGAAITVTLLLTAGAIAASFGFEGMAQPEAT